MILWWILNIVLIAVIVPVVVVLLRGVLASARNLRGALDDIAVVGGTMVTALEPVPQLVTTVSLVNDTTNGLARYGRALDRIL